MWWFNTKRREAGSALEPLGKLETALMKHIWRCGESNVRELQREFLSPLAYTTIMTTMDRLYKKGLLSRRLVGKAFLYAARMNEKHYQELIAQRLIDLALHSGIQGNVVLSHFVDAVGEKDREMLTRLDALIKAKLRSLRRLNGGEKEPR